MDVDVAIVNGGGREGEGPLPVFHVTKRHLAV